MIVITRLHSRRPTWRPVWLAVLLSSACDPMFATQYRQALAPAPAQGCVARVLDTSPIIGAVFRDTSTHDAKTRESFQIAVRDSLVRSGQWTAQLREIGTATDSSAVAITYSYPGFSQPTDDERLRWEQQAKSVLEAIRARCAPKSLTEVTCSSMGGNRRGCRT